ncbi:MAG: PEP-CTERM sorting domain-containing protein [Methylophilaceae bacterium]
MQFKTKALVAALMLASAASASAAVNTYSSGNGELLFNVYDKISHVSFSMDLTPIAAYSQFGTFTMNDFMPGELNNAQGLTGVTTGPGSIPSVTGFAAAGSAEAAGISMGWNLASLGGAAWTNFTANAGDSANWKWNVIAGDSTGSATAANAQRFLTTVANTAPAFNQASGSFVNLATTASLITAINSASAAADPAVYFSASNAGRFENSFTFNWKTTLPVDSTGAVGDSLRVFYLTGRSNVAINEQFENGAAFGFNGTDLTYTTTPVPEADTAAMLLAGLGLMGFIARRRTQA